MLYILGKHKVKVPNWLNEYDVGLVDSHMSATVLSLKEIRILKAKAKEATNKVYREYLEEGIAMEEEGVLSHLSSIDKIVSLAEQGYRPKEQGNV